VRRVLGAVGRVQLDFSARPMTATTSSTSSRVTSLVGTPSATLSGRDAKRTQP